MFTKNTKNVIRMVLWHEVIALFATLVTAVWYARKIVVDWRCDYQPYHTSFEVFVKELHTALPIILTIGIFTLLISLHNANMPIDIQKIGTFSLILCYERIALIASFITAFFYSVHIVATWWEAYIQIAGISTSFNNYMSHFINQLLGVIPIILLLGLGMFVVGLFHSSHKFKNLPLSYVR